MESVIVAIASVVVGLVVGVLSGMLGIGGGTVLVPIFKLGFMLPPIVCTGTSLFVVVLSSVTGAVAHVKNRTCLLKVGLAAGIGGACMSPVGVWLASLSPDWAIMTAASLVILYSSITMLRKALKAPKARKAPGCSVAAVGQVDAQGAAVAEVAPTGTAAPAAEGGVLGGEAGAAAPASALPAATRRQVGLGFIIGLVAGILGGYVGVGGGFIMVPLFMTLLKMPMKATSGTSLIAVCILAIPGVITQAVLGNVDWLVGLAIAVGSMPGAVVGARLMDRVPERTLRFLFAGLLGFAAIMLVVDQL